MKCCYGWRKITNTILEIVVVIDNRCPKGGDTNVFVIDPNFLDVWVVEKQFESDTSAAKKWFSIFKTIMSCLFTEPFGDSFT